MRKTHWALMHPRTVIFNLNYHMFCMGMLPTKNKHYHFSDIRHILIEPSHEKCGLCHMRTTKAQIKPQISSLQLDSVVEQAGFSLTWSETPEDTFSYDEAQLEISTV